ncbi:MAG: hypothetical protein JNM14_11545, partial [Ferruginibacter sp.]|nr:hypothetical protein [Ferruginibacter sp.]
MLAESKLDFVSLNANKKFAERKYWGEKTITIENINPLQDYDCSNLKRANDEYHVDVPREIYAALEKIAANYKAKHIILLAGLSILIQRYGSVSGACIFTPAYQDIQISGSQNAIVPVMSGGFSEFNFKQYVNHIKEDFVHGVRHSNYPVHYMLGLEKQQLADTGVIGCVVNGLQQLSSFDELQVDLLFSFFNSGAQTLTVTYNNGKFSRGYIQRLAHAYFSFLKTLMDNPEQLIGKIGLGGLLSSDAERHLLLETYNATAAFYPEDQTIVDLFEAQVLRSPDHIALECEGQEVS